MRKNKSFCLLMVLTILVSLIVAPVQAFAADKGTRLPSVSKISNNDIPSINEISSDPNYSEGFSGSSSGSLSFSKGLAMSALSAPVAGGCSITKVSSSSVNISGYSTCGEYDPGLTITLSLQAYYSGSWRALQTISRTQSGTYVSLAQGYSVTPGYYYRTCATHRTSDGDTTYSYTNGIYVG